MAASCGVQLLATLRRNALIKWRDGARTTQEIFLPLYIIVLLILVKLVQPELQYPPTEKQPVTDANCRTEVGGRLICWDFTARGPGENLVAFAPLGSVLITNLVTGAVADLSQRYPYLWPLSAKGFADEASLIDYYDQNPGSLYAALVFDIEPSAVTLPRDLSYSIRVNGSYLPSSSAEQAPREDCRPSASYEYPSECGVQKYLTSGFLSLQGAVHRAAASLALPDTCGPLAGNVSSTAPNAPGHAFAQQQPLPAYSRGFASVRFRLFAAMYIVWALAPIVQTVLSHIVHEKEALIKDCMLLMGLQESVYWLAWLMVYTTMAGVTSAVVLLATWFTALFEFSSLSLLFFLFFFYCWSLVALAFFLSTMFTRARSATAFSGLLILLGSLMVIPIDVFGMPTFWCGLFSLFSPVALVLAIDTVVIAEGAEEGVHATTLFSRSVGLDPGDRLHPLSVGGALCLILVDTLLYLVLAWYFDNVWPHPQRGAKRRWNYIFKRSYWSPQSAAAGYGLLNSRRGSRAHTGDVNVAPEALFGEDPEEEDTTPAAVHSPARNPQPLSLDEEPVGPDLAQHPAVVITKLRKVYPPSKASLLLGWLGMGGMQLRVPFKGRWFKAGGSSAYNDRRGYAKFGTEKGQQARETVAVKDLTMTLYEGQVFAFLGHSGSGKSTVIAMLSGLSRPTGGEAYVYGQSISGGGPLLHGGGIVGVCPEQNISSGLLTVQEQLEFFQTIKTTRYDPGVLIPGTGGALATQDGVPTPPAERIAALINELGLGDVRYAEVSSLGEAARRKVSIAIALLGDPQLLLIDEPTSDMDPISRKQVWDALSRRRAAGRCVVIATNSMDEADVLADRKAILSHGVSKCCGSSLFLKNKFGLSYLLHITKGDNFDGPAVLRLIQKHLEEAIPVVGGAMGSPDATFRLPLGRSAEVARMMIELTENAEALGVAGGGLEATTLEEVFMQFAGEAEDEAGTLKLVEGSSRRASLEDEEDTQRSLLGSQRREDDGDLEGGLPRNGREGIGMDQETADGSPTLKAQAKAVARAKLKVYLRRPGAVIYTFGLPILFALMALFIQFGYHSPAPSSLELFDSDLGHSTPILFTAPNAAVAQQAKQVLNKLGPNYIQLDTAALDNRLNQYANGESGDADFVALNFTTLSLTGCQADYVVLYQPWSPHQLPTVAAMVDSALLQAIRDTVSQATKLGRGEPLGSLHVRNHPLPYSGFESLFGYFVAVIVGIGMLLVPPILAGQVVTEAEIGLRPLLRISGLTGPAFWAGNFVPDILFYALGALVILVAGFIFNQPPFIRASAPAVVLLFLAGLPALVLLAYAWSFSYRSAQAASSAISMGMVFIGVLPYFIVIIMQATEDPSLPLVHTVLSFIDPPYAFVTGLHFIASSSDALRSASGSGAAALGKWTYFFTWDSLIPSTIIGLFTAGALLALRLWQLERQLAEPEVRAGEAVELMLVAQEAAPSGPPSAELAAEKQKVQQQSARWDGSGGLVNTQTGQEEEALVLCCGVSKTYEFEEQLPSAAPRRPSVNDLWLSVSKGETVVVVGSDHSGKSSLLSCLAGATPLTHGDALICGYSLRYSLAFQHHNFVGYCPEREVTLGSLSVREHLALFAAVKGLPAPQSIAVESALVSAGLAGQEADQLAKKCAPGTLRRLGVAIALLGGPPVLLLDEPTHGMDVGSRRQVWSQITTGSAGRATLICTQSVEEAEALGSRVGVLVNGQLQCLGTPQHLKKEFGSDYSLTVQAAPQRIPAIRSFVTTLFPPEGGATRKARSSVHEEDRGGEAKLAVPVSSLQELAMLLHELETKRDSLGIEDYSVSQPTLQQVFYRLSRGL